MAYLKYFICRDKKGKLHVDSLSCLEGHPIVEPTNFVEWWNPVTMYTVPPSKDLIDKLLQQSNLYWTQRYAESGMEF